MPMGVFLFIMLLFVVYLVDSVMDHRERMAQIRRGEKK